MYTPSTKEISYGSSRNTRTSADTRRHPVNNQLGTYS
jgi:hypothetical protein